MEDTKGVYIQEGEIARMDVHLSNEGANLIGHGEGKEEILNLAEMIKNLKKDVQIHKDYNESLMKFKENKDNFTMKLMHSLNRI
jgi:hypothetical protein